MEPGCKVHSSWNFKFHSSWNLPQALQPVEHQVPRPMEPGGQFHRSWNVPQGSMGYGTYRQVPRPMELVVRFHIPWCSSVSSGFGGVPVLMDRGSFISVRFVLSSCYYDKTWHWKQLAMDMQKVVDTPHGATTVSFASTSMHVG